MFLALIALIDVIVLAKVFYDIYRMRHPKPQRRRSPRWAVMSANRNRYGPIPIPWHYRTHVPEEEVPKGFNLDEFGQIIEEKEE